MIKSTQLIYEPFIGYYATDDSIPGNKPIILVIHDWSGCNDFARRKAEAMAALGYIGFAIDMYGEGKLGKTKEEKMALMQPLMSDRAKLKDHLLAAITAATTIPGGNNKKIAAIGFCFGGLCALDLARSVIPHVQGVVSFHGLLDAPTPTTDTPITSKVLSLHGHDDPMGNPEQVMAFQNEMTKRNADWQMMIYGNTLHAFTNPDANDPAFGTVYSATTDMRSFQQLREFLTDIL